MYSDFVRYRCRAQGVRAIKMPSVGKAVYKDDDDDDGGITTMDGRRRQKVYAARSNTRARGER